MDVMSGRCCVFQPFDNGLHEKRYKDIVESAIRAAGLEPYRVDRDDGALIPIDSLHEEIRNATVCLADISTTNANVMYELGAATASNKNVVIISSSGSEEFPFDIRHRAVIKYSRDSSSDFEKLKEEITKRLLAILKRQVANRDYNDGGVLPSAIRDDMERAGFTRLATGLAFTSLERQGLLVSDLESSSSFNSDPWPIYKLTGTGEDWLLENQDRLELRVKPRL
jgi:hypothetical protein